MKEPRTLSGLAEAELADLRAAGCVLTDADIVRVNALCWEVENPSHRLELSRGRPVAVGGTWLWPLTIAAQSWFDRVGCWVGNGDIALAYAMANGRGEGIDAATESDVMAWFEKLTCTRSELQEAMEQIIDQGERDPIPPPKNKGDVSYGDIVRGMMREHGGTPELWERYVALDYVLDAMITGTAQADATGKPSDPARNRANLALALAIDEIKARCANG